MPILNALLPACLGTLTLLPLQSPPPDSQPAAARPPDATGFIFKTIKIDNESYDYCVFVPPDYDPNRPWPVILFLHGSGERGTNGFLQTEVGLGTTLRRIHTLVPAVVVMPQCRPNDVWWSEPMTRLALDCVEKTSREYHLDRDRFYITGLSLGGAGAWQIAARIPEAVAAVVPVCGFAELGQSTGLHVKLADALKDVPAWVFHGARDDRVPVIKAREMVGALKERGAAVRYTEFPEGGHAVWDQAYGDPALWKWLFEQRRRGAAQTAPAQRP